jgi:hypothetical protein
VEYPTDLVNSFSKIYRLAILNFPQTFWDVIETTTCDSKISQQLKPIFPFLEQPNAELIEPQAVVDVLSHPSRALCLPQKRIWY